MEERTQPTAQESPHTGRQVAAVYGAGLLQGLALVTFPAASSVFTSRAAYDLTSGQYGFMFLPQTVMGISTALLGARIERRWGEKRILLAGLSANLGSMALLVASRFALGARPVAVTLLLFATALMGAGFGLTVPALNRLAGALFPRRVDVAVLALNALLGLGTALAPLLVAVFVGLGAWWGLPLAVGALLAALLVSTLPLPLDAAAAPATSAARSRRFWLFVAFAIGYGVVETLNGNWAILFMEGVLKAPAALAAVALTAFWAAATIGRILFAAVDRWLPARTTFRLLPWVIAAAFVALSLVPASAPTLGVLIFALAGLGCSALLPLTISLGQSDAPTGHLVAGYQFGYGLAAFGIAPLHSAAGLGLRTVFGGASGVALILAGLALTLGAGATGSADRRDRASAAIDPSPSRAR
ncbi:MAG TPA: MFS transporter [Polyangia bacterium]|nr:MFS transporter [Polyangia bacterium]